MAKKVGLSTCFLDNYGACLQAYALQEEIMRLGYDCRVIPFIEPDGYYDGAFFWLRILKAKLTRNWSACKQYEKMMPFYRFRKKYLRFEKRSFGRINYYYTYDQLQSAPIRYDAYVCGSDQIWNPTFYGKNNPAYFLQFAQDKKKVAYAPSIGLSEMPDDYQQEFKNYVSTFHALSTREEKGAEIVQKIGGRDCATVLDPTLLMGGEFWKDKTKAPKKFPYEKYIFCYLFSNTDKVSEYVRNLQKKSGLPVVYLPISELDYGGMDALCLEGMGPQEFTWLIQNAEYVLTDSFHASAFSTMFHKQFAVVNRQRVGEDVDMSSRIVNLMKMTGIERGFVDLESEPCFATGIDYCAVEKNMQAYRQESETFLREALED